MIKCTKSSDLKCLNKSFPNLLVRGTSLSICCSQPDRDDLSMVCSSLSSSSSGTVATSIESVDFLVDSLSCCARLPKARISDAKMGDTGIPISAIHVLQIPAPPIGTLLAVKLHILRAHSWCKSSETRRSHAFSVNVLILQIQTNKVLNSLQENT